MDLGIAGRTALVCASSKGLGFATAMRLAREGAAVAVCGRDTAAVEQAAARIRADGGRCAGIAVDLDAAADRRRLVAETRQVLGEIDILVLNTGGPPTGAFADLDTTQWHAAYQLLVEPAVHLAQLVLPRMVERRWGRLLAVASFGARQPADQLVLSNSLRAAVIGLMRTLANEYGPHGVTCNSILPGYIRTERMDKVVRVQAEARGIGADGAVAAIAARIPVRRLGRPEEFGDTAAFLVSDLAGYINGAALTIDGGLVGSVY